MMSTPKLPEVPLSQEVAYKDVAYRQVGGSWIEDKNKHFSYQGEDYFVYEGGDVNDREQWYHDTGANDLRSQSQYEQHTANQANLEAINTQNQINTGMLNQAKEQLALERRRFEAEQKRIAQELAKLEAERTAKAEAEQERLRRKQKGRKATILTGGQGLNSAAPTKRKTLLGG
jgi:hypothetical protein